MGQVSGRTDQPGRGPHAIHSQKALSQPEFQQLYGTEEQCEACPGTATLA
jgi:hypothetical protein